jgi:hypothetical protein
MKVWTAQYRYDGPDRLDITVKGQDPLGKHFAPTWKMVMDLKEGKMSQQEYIDEYHKMMERLYLDRPEIWAELMSKEEVTLVCFCKPDKFCHRHLLRVLLQCKGAEWMRERV